MSRLNRGFTYRERLGDLPAGMSVLEYLTRTYDHSSREVWRERIEAGLVHLDDEPVHVATLARPGGRLSWARPPWCEPEVSGAVHILGEDAEYLAVEKPGGLPTLPGGGYLENTLLAWVRARFPEAVPAHRLGRWTSGVMLFARTARARSHFACELREERVTKRYRALASGKPLRAAWAEEARIGPVPHVLLGTVEAVHPDGRSARSQVTVLEARDGGFLADVVIRTGRPHQVRIHLAASGHPLVGDPLYPVGGIPRPDATALPGDPGYRLHAAEIRVQHPVREEDIVVVSRPPLELRSRREQTGPGAID